MSYSGSGGLGKTNDVIAGNRNNSNNASSSPGSSAKEQTAGNSGFTIPSISLPKGGGAIRGMGEKFAANPVTGTGSLSVPIFTSPGRSGFGPSLSLEYDSGSGNGPFGFGWNLSLPSITRKTSKGIPKYQDEDESDVFILSGAEDLVPAFAKEENGDWKKDVNGSFVIDEHDRYDHTVRRYIPRTEGLFARIERWTHKTNGDVHWRSISKDNILTVYGKSKESRIADPSDETRVFSWLICESYDDKGNAIVYKYAQENGKGIDEELLNVNERNRIRSANRYIKTIFYGNRRPLLVDPNKASFRKSHLELTEDDLSTAGWMFQAVFDYDEGHYKEIPLDGTKPADEQHQLVEAAATPGSVWSGRPDIFSVYRSSFEIRTYRRCHRVLMFHNFPELGSEPYLVRSTEFDYSNFDYSAPSFTVTEELDHKGSTRIASFIQNVTQSGYLTDETKPIHEVNGVRYLTYIKKSMPPLEFEYSKCKINQDIKDIDETSLENLPVGIDGTGYQLVDLDGEGVSGILTEQADTWFYKPNLGGGKFGPIQIVTAKPSTADLNSGRQQLMDLAGDGQLDLVQLSGSVPGFYERTRDKDWENFVPFDSLPNVSWNDPNLRLVDLTGDGHADILITENEVFTWYQSLAEKGFEPSTKVFQELDEEKGPRLVLSESSQSIYLADMSGDGLSDLVRIKNGEVCYWPNLGYGRFGAKITMDNSPWFDAPDQFDSKKIKLVDVDGSGVTDINYVGGSENEGIKIYFNQSGDRWSNPYYLDSGIQIDNHSSVQVADLFGNGTACLVWSSPLPGNSRKPVRYLDLMGGTKPHLLVKSANNLGAETRVRYVSSTKFYLEDKAAGKPWITRLPFPVHVIQQVETYDYISRNLFVTRYVYHHGYFDGIEQEFRGFGMVEQFDTEEFANLSNNDAMPDAENVDTDSHIPPAYTKTWFHTGIYHGRHHISDYFVDEYYLEPEWKNNPAEARKHLLDDTILPRGLTMDEELTVDEEYEACRALKGSMLRQEVFSKDGSENEDDPYTVTEQNFTIRTLQPRGKNNHAVFFTHAKEVLTYNYERHPEDPRTSHMMTLEVDDFGNVLKQVQIGYGRRNLDPELDPKDAKKQKEHKMIYTDNQVTTNHIDMTDAYRNPLPCESIIFELTDSALSNADPVERFTDSYFVSPEDPTNPLRVIINFKDVINYEDTPTSGKQRRAIEHARTLYRKNDLSAILPLGEIESLALPWDTYKLAFTPGLIDRIYKRRHSDPSNMIENLLPNPADVLGGQGGEKGGYLPSQDLKILGLFPGGDPDDHWWIPSGQIFYSRDPRDGQEEELTFALRHFFLPHRYHGPFGNTTTVSFDSLNNLLIVKVEDQVENIISAGERDTDGNVTPAIDYRLQLPVLIMDPNRNRSEVAFDVLGMVVGTAVMGKPDLHSPEGDNLDHFNNNLTMASIREHLTNPLNNPYSILENASTRLVYDQFAYYRTKFQPNPEPPVAYTMVRETHFNQGNQNSKIQHSFSYSDGFGREIQKKIQTEKGPLIDPRWVGTGWTIFNNKGMPVRQYEPFFSPNHLFEFKHLEGVSPVIFYDPVGRTVIILHPDNTFEKVVFDNWKQIAYDVNDTVLLDPRTDSDIASFVSKYFESQPETWQTWYQKRLTGVLSTDEDEKNAAIKTESHGNTPTISYFDSLGRSFMTLQHNGFEADGTPIQFPTRLEIDIEGNTRGVRDAIKQNGDTRGRIVTLYDYDMLGTVIHQTSMDSGERWMLNDVQGNLIRAWDSREHTFLTEYDTLRRPVRSYVITIKSLNPFEVSSALVERTVYGEQHPNDVLLNLRLRIYLHLDQAGVLRNEACDFKGNLLSSKRQLTRRYKGILDWKDIDVDNVIPKNNTTKLNVATLDAALASLPQEDQIEETFISSTKYDALNRPVLIETPHSTMPPNIIKPFYNEANMLEKLYVNLRSEKQNGETVWTPFVVNIDYDSKGRRVLIEYGNGYINNSQHGVITTYKYDKSTSRLVEMVTGRNAVIFHDDCPPPNPSWPGCKIQNLSYTYDPVGNITHVQDDGQQSIFFQNQWVEPSSDYTYDALYQLIEATGREHLGQVGAHPVPHSSNDVPRAGLTWSANDGNLLGKYVENYLYDAVGNIKSMHHRSTSDSSHPCWSRSYDYNKPSLIEPAKYNNRLGSTTVSGNNPVTENYLYDTHGNTVLMPHLASHQNLNEANMHWNYKDQLQQVDLGGGGVAYYVYDATGQRIRKVSERSPGLIEEKIFLGAFEVFRRRNGSGIINLERETLRVMDDQQRICLVETRIKGEEPDIPIQLIRYQLGNHLGSVIFELDEEAQIITYEEYSPYGSTLYQAGRILAEVKLKRYRYMSEERDEESGLYYYGARYYASWLARWISSDPLIHAHISSYAAFALNPISYTDPNGASPTKPPSGWDRFVAKARNFSFWLIDVLGGPPPTGEHPVPPPIELEANPKTGPLSNAETEAEIKGGIKRPVAGAPPGGGRGPPEGPDAPPGRGRGPPKGPGVRPRSPERKMLQSGPQRPQQKMLEYPLASEGGGGSGAAGRSGGGGGSGAAGRSEVGIRSSRLATALKVAGFLESTVGEYVNLWLNFAATIAQGKEQLREENYVTGFSQGLAASLLFLQMPHLGHDPAFFLGETGPAYEGVRVRAINEGKKLGYKFGQNLPDELRVKLRTAVVEAIAKKGQSLWTTGKSRAFNPDDVYIVAAALRPIVIQLFADVEAKRRDEERDEEIRRKYENLRITPGNKL
jgi:RHS repeat-associated protein